jgi:hypothetical protein
MVNMYENVKSKLRTIFLLSTSDASDQVGVFDSITPMYFVNEKYDRNTCIHLFRSISDGIKILATSSALPNSDTHGM